MADGWSGANVHLAECYLCGAQRTELRLFHLIDQRYDGVVMSERYSWARTGDKVLDHIVVCEKCAMQLDSTMWHGCGCGG